MQRRQFLSAAIAATGASLLAESVSAQENRRANLFNRRKSEDKHLHIAVNQYTVTNFYKRENIDFWTKLDEIKSAGVDGIEATFGSGEDVATVGKRLADHNLEMRSIYLSGNLHDEDAAEKEVARLLEFAEKAKPFGTKIIVFNPAAKKGKSDAELIRQSKNANIVGAGWKKHGITMAFHYHTSELEFGGREFHHFLCGTDPKKVSLCFEQHWSYRASGNSEVAVFDHLKLYADRCVEVHLRQSIDGVWSETFADGDIDNVRLAAGLKKLPQMPHISLEQAPEKGTPNTMSAAEVLRKSVEYVRRVFG